MTTDAKAAPRRICAVVVTYQPDVERLVSTLDRLRREIAHIIVVDNDSRVDWEPILARNPQLIVEELGNNEGIAFAQNRGIRIARTLMATHVLLMDQDSRPDAGMVEHLLRATERLVALNQRPACVGPRIRMSDNNTLSGFYRLRGIWPSLVPCNGKSDVVQCDSLIASGTLIRVEVLDEVGGMEEALFIDVVDEEWCLRARAKGYAVFGACAAVLEHRLGESARHVWLGRWRRVPRHKAFRYYYMFRNTIAVGLRSYVPTRWAIFQAIRLTALLISYGLLTKDRCGELRFMMQGIRHALNGTSGRRPAE